MPKLWFKAKRYGWGWTPASIEGWLITIILILIIITIAFKYAETNILKFFLYLIISILTFMFIAYKKGEKPRWGK